MAQFVTILKKRHKVPRPGGPRATGSSRPEILEGSGGFAAQDLGLQVVTRNKKIDIEGLVL